MTTSKERGGLPAALWCLALGGTLLVAGCTSDSTPSSAAASSSSGVALSATGATVGSGASIAAPAPNSGDAASVPAPGIASSSDSAAASGPRSTGATGSSTTATSTTSNPSVVPPLLTSTIAQRTLGNINETVPSVSLTSLPPIALGKTAVTGKVLITIASYQSVTAQAKGPGEVSGPAVKMTISIKNGTTAPIDVSKVVVNVTDRSGVPSSQFTGPPATSFSGTLAAGKSSSAIYVYSLTSDHENPVNVSVSYSPSAPIVQFVGAVK